MEVWGEGVTCRLRQFVIAGRNHSMVWCRAGTMNPQHIRLQMAPAGTTPWPRAQAPNTGSLFWAEKGSKSKQKVTMTTKILVLTGFKVVTWQTSNVYIFGVQKMSISKVTKWFLHTYAVSNAVHVLTIWKFIQHEVTSRCWNWVALIFIRCYISAF